MGRFDGDLLEGEGLIGFVGIGMGDRFRGGASGPESAMVWSGKPTGERRRKGRLGGHILKAKRLTGWGEEKNLALAKTPLERLRSEPRGR